MTLGILSIWVKLLAETHPVESNILQLLTERRRQARELADILCTTGDETIPLIELLKDGLSLL